MTNQFTPGLEGIIAVQTSISNLDVVESRILIKGFDLIELAGKKKYLDVAHLLIEGRLPTKDERNAVEARLKEHYELPESVYEIFKLLPKTTHPMDLLRTGISILAGYDTDLDDRSPEKNREQAYELLGKIPTIVANGYHILHDEPIVPPDPSMGYSENFLYMITGKKPTQFEIDTFDKSLLLYSEHELPNSTFTARSIASTNSDLYGALVGAVASLKGNLHGGANEAVMEMLLEAETVEGMEKMIRNRLANKDKIMGFGHRVYMKKVDPRALVMREALRELCRIKEDDTYLDMCEKGAEIMAAEKGLYPNLDYPAAPVYWELGIPVELYTPIFFCARTVGLCSHVLEQHSNNRIFRPRADYIGPAYGENGAL